MAIAKTEENEQTETCGIPEGWEESLIGDHIELVYGDGLPERNRKNGSVPVFGSNGITGFHDKVLVKGPGIIIGRKGTVGQVTLSKVDFWPIDTTYYVKLRDGNDIFFWYYLLQTLGLNRMNSHSAVPGLNRDDVYSILKEIPSLDEQHAIAKILSDLDAKIELNHQMNKTLEQIVQAIFKRWFVDFQFPRHEKTKFVNGLPDGWREDKLREIMKIESGKRPAERSEVKTLEFSVPLLGASSVMGFVKNSLFIEPILIIGRVGTHGVIQRVSCPSFPSDNTLVIRSPYFEFIYQILKTINYDALNVGTTQPLITQTSINNYPIILPKADVLDKFESNVSGFFMKIEANNRENESLTQIRDSLLSRLMSGKIRVNKEG